MFISAACRALGLEKLHSYEQNKLCDSFQNKCLDQKCGETSHLVVSGFRSVEYERKREENVAKAYKLCAQKQYN